jgi:CHASE1-domain containing sensor protein
MFGTARYVCPGDVSMECMPTKVESKNLEKYVPLGLGLGLLVAALVLLLVFCGRQILTELASARINRIKKG